MAIFYFTASSQDLLDQMLISVVGGKPEIQYQNVLGPAPAIPPTPAGTDSMGNPIAATAGAGVAGQWYVSINLPDVNGTPAVYAADGVTVVTPAVPAVFTNAVPNGVTEDTENGTAVLGVWA